MPQLSIFNQRLEELIHQGLQEIIQRSVPAENEVIFGHNKRN